MEERKPKNFYEKQVLELLKQKYEVLKAYREKRRLETEAQKRKSESQNAKKGILPLPPPTNVPGLVLPVQPLAALAIAGNADNGSEVSATAEMTPHIPPTVEEELPAGWQKFWSKSWNKHYYFNTKTQEKSWTLPIPEPVYPPMQDEMLEEMAEPSKEDMHLSSINHNSQGLTKAVFDAVTLILEKEHLLLPSDMDTDMVDTLRNVPPSGALTAIAKFRKVDLAQVKDRRGLLRSMIHRQLKFRKDVSETNFKARTLSPEVSEALDRYVKAGRITEGVIEIKKALAELSPAEGLQLLSEFDIAKNLKNPTGFIMTLARKYQQESILGKRRAQDMY